MKAMILAAGRGTRVRPLTISVPKPMLPILGRPVMEPLVEHLVRCGVTELAVNISYLGSVIQDYFGDGERFGLSIAYSSEGRLEGCQFIDEALGSAGGMKRVHANAGFFDQTFVVMCADALIDLDLARVVAAHKARGALATVVVKRVAREDVSKYGVAETAPDSRILRFQEKPQPDEAVSTLANTGIYVFEPAVLDFIPSGAAFDIGGQLLPLLASRGLPIYAHEVPFQWIDIGSIADYWEANRMALRGEINGFRLPGREIAPGVRVGANVRIDLARVRVEGPVFIGGGSVVADEVTIVGPTVIGANSVIERGAHIEACLLGNYIRVARAAKLARKILCNGHLIEPDGFSISVEEHDLGWLADDARRGRLLDENYRTLVGVTRLVAKREKAATWQRGGTDRG